MPAERGEVDAEAVEVHGHVGNALAGVEHGQSADGRRGADDPVDGRDRARHIGHVGEGDELSRLVDGRQGRRIEAAPLIAVDPPQARPGAGAQLLPRHEVGMVLGPRRDDRISRADAR